MGDEATAVPMGTSSLMSPGIVELINLHGFGENSEFLKNQPSQKIVFVIDIPSCNSASLSQLGLGRAVRRPISISNIPEATGFAGAEVRPKPHWLSSKQPPSQHYIFLSLSGAILALLLPLTC